jgi:high mobility group protein B1
MVKKDSSKPRGKMSAYAFFLQVYREELKQRNPNESVNFAEFSKRCAEKWKGMNEQQKKRFNDMAAQDKSRHAQEMEHYQPPPGERGGKRKRGKKDPNAPKRALSAFFWFCNEERPNVKASLQNSNSVSLVAKELGRRWALVRPEHKARYEALAAKDKERYEKEQKVYKARPGAAGPPAKKPAAAKAVAPAQLAAIASDEDDEEDDEDDEEDDE